MKVIHKEQLFSPIFTNSFFNIFCVSHYILTINPYFISMLCRVANRLLPHFLHVSLPRLSQGLVGICQAG